MMQIGPSTEKGFFRVPGGYLEILPPQTYQNGAQLDIKGIA